jgi:phosphoserine aminotransferase
VTEAAGAGARVFNFSAGPAVLPLEVLLQARDELVCLPGVGQSVLEISHRSPAFDRILADTLDALSALLGVPETHEILLLQGGASLQFSMIPMNLLRGGSAPADYLLTGSWGSLAAKEAVREGEVRIAWDGADDGYGRLPEPGEISWSDDAAYVHFTSNETIQGVQWQQEPVTRAPLVADSSSDFLSRPVDIARYGLLYACAQKNAGIAGVTVVVVRKDLLERSERLERAGRALPSMLDYRTHARNGSRANTPPVFAVYVLGLVCRWLRDSVGGLDRMREINELKAASIYAALDASGGFYRGHAAPPCRSRMNVTFRLPSEDLEKRFLSAAKTRGLTDLKGHRSVGGIRASLYNAMPTEGVQALRDFLVEFQAQAG